MTNKLRVFTKDLRPRDYVVGVGTVVSVQSPSQFRVTDRDGVEQVVDDASPGEPWYVDRSDVIHTPAGERSAVIAEAVLADAVRVERPALPTDSNERKRTPLCTGCLDYFPAALTAVAEHAESTPVPMVTDMLALLRDRELVRLARTAICVLHNELTGLVHGVASDDDVGLEALFRAFPSAIAAIAQVSWLGNEKHNPGQPLHHARGKSTDHFDCIARHYVERGGFDGPMRHSACLAWRALAALQEDLESKGAPKARGAK